MKHHNAPVRVGYLFDFHAEANLDEQLVRSGNEIKESRTANDGSWRLVCDAKQKRATAFIGDSYAILGQLLAVIAGLGFLEFKALSFRRRRPPKINLGGCRDHRLSIPFNRRALSSHGLAVRLEVGRDLATMRYSAKHLELAEWLF